MVVAEPGSTEATQTYLSEARKGYIRRRDSIKLQVQVREEGGPLTLLLGSS